MKALMLGLICLSLSPLNFAGEKHTLSEQDTQLLFELIDGTMAQEADNYTSAELDRAEQIIESLGVKKAYCCRGTRGPSMRCRTPMRFRCSKKPGCYWNC